MYFKKIPVTASLTINKYETNETTQLEDATFRLVSSDAVTCTLTVSKSYVSENGNALTAGVDDLVATFTLTSDSSTDTPSYSETIDITGEGTIEFTGLAYNGTYILSEASMTGFEDVGDITIEVVNGIIYVDNNEIVQIVIEYVTIDGQGIYNLAEGINDSILDEYLLTYIRESGITIKISTADGTNPAIENENATTDNYTVRWYVLKEQVDGWHIDGVMVAKTAVATLTSSTFRMQPLVPSLASPPPVALVLPSST